MAGRKVPWTCISVPRRNHPSLPPCHSPAPMMQSSRLNEHHNLLTLAANPEHPNGQTDSAFDPMRWDAKNLRAPPNIAASSLPTARFSPRKPRHGVEGPACRRRLLGGPTKRDRRTDQPPEQGGYRSRRCTRWMDGPGRKGKEIFRLPSHVGVSHYRRLAPVSIWEWEWDLPTARVATVIARTCCHPTNRHAQITKAVAPPSRSDQI